MSIGADAKAPGSVIEVGQIQMSMNTQTKLGLGSAMATVAALGIVLSLLLEWSAAPRPWGFLLGFVFGVLAGLGVTLAVAGLIERRRGP
jgi:predicted ABC-type sugar transport system permease subunit